MRLLIKYITSMSKSQALQEGDFTLTQAAREFGYTSLRRFKPQLKHFDTYHIPEAGRKGLRITRESVLRRRKELLNAAQRQNRPLTAREICEAAQRS